MTSKEIRKRFFNFFEERGHVLLPSAPLIPENDSSVLFTTAGMQPFVPYLLGEKHPQGTRLVNVQKVVRTVDIEEIGDDTHHTFFEMLGNWSLGDYFKKEAIRWSYELLTQEFNLDPSRLYITVFEGNEDAPRDDESIEIWKSLGVPEHRIYTLPAENNWWSPGENGPCGPDTEMFYDVTEKGLGDMSKEEFLAADDRQDVVEIWNDVFMEYEKKDGKVIGTLSQKNVDTGAGLERLARVLQGVESNYDTDLFTPIIDVIRRHDMTEDSHAIRVIADHIRTATLLSSEGVTPSNTDQGYILRRLIRRLVMKTTSRNVTEEALKDLINAVISIYEDIYTDLVLKKDDIYSEINKEIESFASTLESGLKEFNKLEGDIAGEEAFTLFASHGFPIELTVELAQEKGVDVDQEGYYTALQEHRAVSREGASKKFKGGLADHSEMSVKYHTATHLLNAALRNVLGDHVLQKGSNITPERLRFDFSHTDKLTDEEKEAVEQWVNEQIQKDLPVGWKEVSLDEARDMEAMGVFDEKYTDTVKVYSIGEGNEAVSKEICGGPHVERTGLLGTFSITKEESSSQGVRRIKAILA